MSIVFPVTGIHVFSLLEKFNDAFDKKKIVRASFLHPITACRARQLIFFKVKTLLNSAFNQIT